MTSSGSNSSPKSSERPICIDGALIGHGTFMREFISADAPCFALGLEEEGKRRYGFVALRLGKAIPREVPDLGFRLGYSLFGNANFEVVHFAFEFYGFETYNALVNPNNPLARVVLEAMVESGDYFFFSLDSNESATASRSEIGQDNLMMLKNNLACIRASTTTRAEYKQSGSVFREESRRSEAIRSNSSSVSMIFGSVRANSSPYFTWSISTVEVMLISSGNQQS